jgi:hypothetical protein
VVNEILVNVPTGPGGDANGDGVRDPFDDEFVELVSTADGPVDLSHVQIRNGSDLRFSFEPFCLPAHESVVVFGGGSVGGSIPQNAIVSPARFAFGNDGGRVVVTGPSGTLATLDYDRSAPSSFTRAPQITGQGWVDHHDLSVLPFSPGRCANGDTLSGGCPMEEPSADAGADL